MVSAKRAGKAQQRANLQEEMVGAAAVEFSEGGRGGGDEDFDGYDEGPTSFEEDPTDDDNDDGDTTEDDPIEDDPIEDGPAKDELFEDDGEVGEDEDGNDGNEADDEGGDEGDGDEDDKDDADLGGVDAGQRKRQRTGALFFSFVFSLLLTVGWFRYGMVLSGTTPQPTAKTHARASGMCISWVPTLC